MRRSTTSTPICATTILVANGRAPLLLSARSNPFGLEEPEGIAPRAQEQGCTTVGHQDRRRADRRARRAPPHRWTVPLVALPRLLVGAVDDRVARHQPAAFHR